MPRSGLHLLLFTIIVHVCTIYGNGVIKSSLTFVIDDTYSMHDEIRQVKDEVNTIFETVLRSNASQIENFILVTFNDPDTKLRTVTKDREEFKRALALIDVHGGDDCPEYAMNGIEIALEESLPSSYLYVFTDASAKDHNRFEHVKNLALKKQTRVDFILTGICGSESDTDYQVYYKVAEATSGMVFPMMKNDVKDILKYVEETIKSKADNVVIDTLPPGYNHSVPYYVDSCAGPTIITATGDKPKIETVTGPGGSKLKKDDIIKLDRVAVSKVTCVTPGDHDVKMGSKSETRAVISAKTNIDFQIRFSAIKPSSIADAVSRPPPTGNAFLSVKLIGDGVKLNATKIRDMDGNVITELPLELLDEKEQFYITPSFDPPITMFRVSISGYRVDSGIPITRNSPTAIERQPIPKATEVKGVKPQVTIERGPKLITEYNDPLELKCKVHGYPQPDIIWVDKDTGINLPATVSVFELPYDFMSILDIEKANKNTTYECKAINAHGENQQHIEVETKRSTYFDVIVTPKDSIRIEYDKNGSIECKVDAYPPASITWFKDGREFTGDANIEMSSDNTTLTFNHMLPESEGNFMCEARNDIDRKVFHTNVIIFGLKAPIIDKQNEVVYATKGTNVVLTCRDVNGIPKSKLYWSFQNNDAKKITKMRETNEVIQLNNVRADQAGLYKCVAENIVDFDSFTIELQVKYQPKIKADVKKIKVRDGDKVTIKCDVDGVPEPTVNWYYNGKVLENTTKTTIFNDNSLRLQATVADTGYYTCEAMNGLGSAEKQVHVIVFVPVSIDIPKVAKIETLVGHNVLLPCSADGYPRPEIKWTFNSSDLKMPSKDVTSHMASNSLKLPMAQLNHQGNYTCTASNYISGSASITYELYVYAAPIIENEDVDKTYKAVRGDLVLRIKCKATGSPKPTIIWKKDGLNLPFGSEWYDLENDGTLVIKNIDVLSQGAYTCLAQNAIGHDSAVYEVLVTNYPEVTRPISKVFLQEGQSFDLTCNITHKKTDLVRWFKDGVEIAVENLNLSEVTQSNGGLYICRVSDLSKSRSVTTRVIVGTEPKFYYDDVETSIDFVRNTIAELDCSAYGVPEPTVTWKHNGMIIDISSMMYALEMKLGETGIYTCEVSNKYGSIQRSFNVTPTDCIIDITKDFPEKQPLMISRALTWPTFEMTDGYMIIPKHDYYFFNCPSGFFNFPGSTFVMAFCEGDTNIKINGKVYDFSEITCKEEAKPMSLPTGVKCLPGNTEYIDVGYKAYKGSLKAYEVCFNKDSNATLFTKHHMSPYHADEPHNSKWFSSYLLPIQFDTMYDCANQAGDISYYLRRKLKYDSCCFTERQLVNSQDLRPGIPAAASFYSLNVVPHWSTCNTKNWKDVEERIRSLVHKAGRDLVISTGADFGGNATDIKLRNGLGGYQKVPPFLWKVVQDPVSQASLAIIQVNIPELSSAEATKHLRCFDICHVIDWMQNTNWKNVKDGFTYCCSIIEFEKAFHFKRVFSPGMKYVLYDVSNMPGAYSKK